MKKLLLVSTCNIIAFMTFAISPNISLGGSLLEGSIKAIDGGQINLEALKGKTLLVVNIATKCGFTPQLEELETLSQKYNSRGFQVLGLPSNDFGGQTPEANKDVKKFCKMNYGVTFPLTSKVKVTGKDKHPFVAKLISSSSDKKEISWNFEKFLVDKNGVLKNRFKSKVKPSSQEIITAIEAVL